MAGSVGQVPGITWSGGAVAAAFALMPALSLALSGWMRTIRSGTTAATLGSACSVAACASVMFAEKPFTTENRFTFVAPPALAWSTSGACSLWVTMRRCAPAPRAGSSWCWLRRTTMTGLRSPAEGAFVVAAPAAVVLAMTSPPRARTTSAWYLRLTFTLPLSSQRPAAP